jgi:hypothetical protein
MTTLELYYDGEWREAPLSPRSSVTITRGRGSEQATAVPSTTAATIDNFSGDYNPHNPVSPLYGVAGRNTPCRVMDGEPNMLGAADDGPGSTTSQVAPSIDAPDAGLLLCVWAASDTSATYTAPAGMTAGVTGDAERMTIFGARQVVNQGATGTRTATSSASRQYLSASVWIQGPNAFPTGTVAPNGTSFFLDVVNPGDLWVVFSVFATSGSGSADSPTTDPPVVPACPSDTDGGGWITLADTGLVDLFNNGTEWARLKAWVKKCRTVDSAHTISLPGADPDTTVSWVTRVPAADVDSDWDIRHVGEVSAWEPDRSGTFEPDTEGDAWTGVTSNGVLRRLRQGTPAEQSALRRSILATGPADYWPMEDGPDSAQYHSALVGHNPMIIDQRGAVQLAGDDSLPGSAALPVVSYGPSFSDDHNTLDTLLTDLGSTWTATWWMRTPKESNMTAGQRPYTSFVVVRATGGDIVAWSFGSRYDVDNDEDEYEFYAIGTDDNLYANVTTAVDHTDDWRYVRVVVTSNGSSIRLRVWINGVSVGDQTSSRNGGTPQSVAVFLQANSIDPGTMPSTLGHLAFWSGEVDPDLQSAGAGWADETAGDRFLRLCAEEGLPASLLGDPDDTMPMGPQPPATLQDLLSEIERTDAGILYEPRTQLGVVYRTRRSLYNQTPALTLDWNDGRMSRLTPTVDDRLVRNDVTVSRRNGSSYRLVQETGPLNVQRPEDDPQGVGRYETEVDVNPARDVMLPDLAGWYLGLGTVDEPRYANLTVDLDLYTAVADDAKTVDIGDLIVVNNLPADLSAEQLRLIVFGYTETIRPARRTITFNCAPAQQYDVGVWGSASDPDSQDTESRYDTAGSTLTSAVDADDTLLSITTSVGQEWTTDANDMPFYILVGGERMRVTAVSGEESPQTVTVTRSVNGVVKSHPAGTAVELADPVVWAL